MEWGSNYPLPIVGLQEADNEDHLSRSFPKVLPKGAPQDQPLGLGTDWDAKSQVLLWTHWLRYSLWGRAQQPVLKETSKGQH